jgi:hypothetical protein
VRLDQPGQHVGISLGGPADLPDLAGRGFGRLDEGITCAPRPIGDKDSRAERVVAYRALLKTEEVRRPEAESASHREIARRLGMGRRSARRIVGAGKTPPPRFEEVEFMVEIGRIAV